MLLLLPHRTVFENVALPLIIQGSTTAGTRKKVTEALRAVSIEHKHNIKTVGLSAGEQQRVCIARAIVNSPILLLADEPTGNLDTNLTMEIVELFKTIHARGTTVMMATAKIEPIITAPISKYPTRRARVSIHS